MTGQQTRLGMAMLILAESVFFFMLILAFIYFRDQSLQTATATLHFRTASFYSACLLASVFTLWRRRVGVTIMLGLVFLAGQGSEYWRLWHSGITISEGLFGTTFFTLTGVHGLHTLTGLGLLAVVAFKKLAVPGVAMFWYFVTGAWLAVFAVVYLWTYL